LHPAAFSGDVFEKKETMLRDARGTITLLLKQRNDHSGTPRACSLRHKIVGALPSGAKTVPRKPPASEAEFRDHNGDDKHEVARATNSAVHAKEKWDQYLYAPQRKA